MNRRFIFVRNEIIVPIVALFPFLGIVLLAECLRGGR